METEIVAAIVGAFGGFISGIVGAYVVLRNKNIDRIVEQQKMWVSAYDTKFLEVRLEEYKKLWKLTKITSHLHIKNLDSTKTLTLADNMTNWYYDDGGMVLSEDARNAFFKARNSLDTSHDNISICFSLLRTALCEDMNSRRGPLLVVGENKDS